MMPGQDSSVVQLGHFACSSLVKRCVCVIVCKSDREAGTRFSSRQVFFPERHETRNGDSHQHGAGNGLTSGGGGM